MTTLAAPPTATARSRWRGTGFGTQVLVLTQRSLRALVSDPRMILFSVLQPLVMLALFSQIFSSIAQTPGFPAGVDYIDYLLPAILVNTAMQSALQAGVGLVSDMKNGVLARFRSLPIRPGSVLVARSLSDLVRTTGQLLLMVLFAAVLFGFSPSGGVVGVGAALLLALAVGWGLGWVFLAVGAWLRNTELMQTVGFLAMFPLMFASSAYVPVGNLPGWLQAVASLNPLTHAVDAARSLSLAQPAEGVLSALVATAVLAAAGWWAAERGFKRPMAG
ncbi:ABC transporter permease [Actinosynnema pretiosum subsp. pretiosum]|uniref:Transport permease protein n=2 Tax=Actinosynnema TaxID=40566 RepID=C6WQ22_ACTMD|nr:ABC transporter permease [Actinosynnema mirum]ACU35078.1 ABC-2 type transporter [Actinosynnema mirum DSM 43827]AXX28433.1 multidrug ABC transporter permease [Actinosynnema pretiosum subsp. pretiosum]QUF07217.1 ABC transporter permease [Actinosynnema pretiosum subsp. pretiosum]